MMTNYIDKPDSEYTYQDWLTFVQAYPPQPIAKVRHDAETTITN